MLETGMVRWLVVILGACLALAVTRTTAQSPATISPEEAVLRLKPDMLSSANVPANDTVVSTQVFTPATLAATLSPDIAPLDALRQFDSEGFLVQIRQIVTPASPSTAHGFIDGFTIDGFASVADADAFVAGQAFPLASANVAVQTIASAPPLGDASAEYHVSPIGTATLAKGMGDYLRWRRGAVAFELWDPLAVNQTALEQLAVAIDAVEAGEPGISFDSPTITPPATEQQRLLALLRLETIAPPSAPNGFEGFGLEPATVADYVAHADDPAAMLQRLDGGWQRLISMQGTYTTTDALAAPNDPAQQTWLWVSLSEDASPAAAVTDLNDVLLGPGDQLQAVPCPVTLGETDSCALITNATSGTSRSALVMGWTHGAVLCTVSMGAPTGKTDAAVLAAFAQSVEANYTQSAEAQ